MDSRVFRSLALLFGASILACSPTARVSEPAVPEDTPAKPMVFSSSDLRDLVDRCLVLGPPYEVPRVVPAGLPPEILTAEPGERKRVFIGTVLPLVLHENERIARERAEVLRLLGKSTLTPAEQEWMLALLGEYRVAPPRNLAPEVIAQAILRRLDEVPVSLALAQAALESGWGTSRAAREGNALFGQYAYTGSEGSYELKGFASLQDCIRDYVRNLNSHPAYSEFRALRLAQRRSGQALDPFALASTLTRYSTRGVDYTEHVHEMMRMNDLPRFDEALLRAVSDEMLSSLTSGPANRKLELASAS